MIRKYAVLALGLVFFAAFALMACGGESADGPLTPDGDAPENDADAPSCSGACVDILPATCQSGKLCSCKEGRWTLTDCTVECLMLGGSKPDCGNDEQGNAVCRCEGLESDGDENEAAEEESEAEPEAEAEEDLDPYEAVELVDVFDFDASSVEGLPTAVCHSGTRWAAGTPAFKDATTAWGLAGIGARGVRLSAVDFDNDGWPDLLVRLSAAGDDFSDPAKRTTYLLRNKGDGTFEDVTEKSGLRKTRKGTDPKIGRGGDVFAFGDFNNDGYLDVYNGKATDTTSGETSEILLNNGDGTFTLGAESSPLRRAADPESPSGASFTDYDHDGNLDLWVSHALYNNDTLGEKLYKGDGLGGFTDVTESLGLLTLAWSQVTFVSSLNGGRANVWAWSANACDLNNDGYPELLAASYGRSPNHLFRAQGPGRQVRLPKRQRLFRLRLRRA